MSNIRNTLPNPPIKKRTFEQHQDTNQVKADLNLDSTIGSPATMTVSNADSSKILRILIHSHMNKSEVRSVDDLNKSLFELIKHTCNLNTKPTRLVSTSINATIVIQRINEILKSKNEFKVQSAELTFSKITDQTKRNVLIIYNKPLNTLFYCDPSHSNTSVEGIQKRLQTDGVKLFTDFRHDGYTKFTIKTLHTSRY
jgi:hypothetical protein